MEVVRDLSKWFSKAPTVVTIGNFDGVHLGHQTIVKKVKELSKEYNLKSGVITFNPHPIKFFNNEIKLIMTERKKKKIFEELGIDYFFNLEFNESIANMDPEIFVRELLVKTLKAKFIVIGYDYRFGKKKKGDYELLKLLESRYGYTAFKIPPVKVDEIIVSSTNIRKLLTEGDVDLANRMLGRAFSLEGEVIKGDGYGKLLGYPTANLKVHNELIPAFGIYATKTLIDGKRYQSVTNIGIRPTIVNREEIRVETHIFDFNEEIYGKFIEVEFYKYLRKERKFDKITDLIGQIEKDCKLAKEVLK
ncbi:bifunctional riboflavin kinase/FAD synthetase [Deferribacter autotrophicus]|uniref:Riboflavin biosynthesis protein n=1 Tax=Deferribacter autotrophicus TaxID=500465 RepID=A0A5A8F3V6_9BACT|nr:bifunctional riboflavin kinase/FAD synthetase [Deferribacter autotrophicus]KAA0258647.1 bifunctional riboflavin kinase/FAD synthetase [Deferribacter autotrophicus]